MRPSLQILAAILLVGNSRAEDPPAFASEALRGKDKMLAPEERQFGASAPEEMKDETGAPVGEDVLRAFQRKDAGPWKIFQDDLISFEYPDDPLIRVAAITPDEEVEIVGGAVGTADRSFQRAYRLIVGRRLPYLTIFVLQSDRFDDGLCFCGPIAHEQLIVANGSLLQFSYLPSGDIKKVQALGAKHRAIALEWTHSAIPQEAFARIGRSLRLQKPGPASRGEWIKRLPNENRLALTSWLEPQMSEKAVFDLLGEPTTKEPDLWTYVEELNPPDGSRWKLTKRIPLKQGQLAPLPRTWVQTLELAPKEGSLRWVEKSVVRNDPPIPGLDGKDSNAAKVKPTEEQVRAAADAFLNWSETPSNWDTTHRWYRAMTDLFEMHLGDPRVLASVEKGFVGSERDQSDAHRFLAAVKSPRLRELTIARCRYILEKAPKHAGELPGLWSAVGAESPEARVMFKSALGHANPDFRAVAVEAASSLLSEKEANTTRFTALEDRDPIVRRAGANPMSWFQDMKVDDLPIFRTYLAKESDPHTKQALQNIVSNLERHAKADQR